MKAILLFASLLSCFAPIATKASNFDECAVTAEVLTLPQDATLQIRIVESSPSDLFARCYQREGKEEEINLYCPSTPSLKVGDNVPLKVMYYGAMGASGPVSGTTWSCVE